MAVQEFYDQHPALRGKRVILFAPTFRGREYTTPTMTTANWTSSGFTGSAATTR